MALLNTDFSVNELDTIFKNSKRIFFIGIGGISMSSLAKFCLSQGKDVFGCDSKRTEITIALEEKCHIKYYSSTDSVCGTDMVIYTTAIDKSNFEYSKAKGLNIPLISRANFLGYVMSRYKNRIGVCGMHGKTTVTSMLNHIFSVAGLSPTTFCGGEMNGYGNEVIGKDDYFIFEACEYLDAFLRLYPTESIITNIDYDHPDYFKSTEQIVSSFQKYACLNKRIYINGDDTLSGAINHTSTITYGINKKCDYNAKITHSPALNEFLVMKNGVEIAKCTLKQHGTHFVYDALCAFAVAYENGIKPDVIENALSTFEGTKRRMEFIKKTDTGADIFCDYGHHPTEIRATIDGLQKMGYKKISCVFQAHTFSRTYYLYNEFKSCFEGVCNLIIAPTFSAREENTFSFTDSDFAAHLGGIFLKEYKEIREHILNTDCDVVLILGAGDINKLREYF